MRAFLGGQFIPEATGQTLIEVAARAAGEADASEPLCGSNLSSPLTRGLPAEYAESTIEAVSDAARRIRLPAGALVIDRAAFDFRYSSIMAFRRASDVLVAAISAIERGGDAVAAAELTMNSWDPTEPAPPLPTNPD